MLLKQLAVATALIFTLGMSSVYATTEKMQKSTTSKPAFGHHYKHGYKQGKHGFKHGFKHGHKYGHGKYGHGYKFGHGYKKVCKHGHCKKVWHGHSHWRAGKAK